MRWEWRGIREIFYAGKCIRLREQTSLTPTRVPGFAVGATTSKRRPWISYDGTNRTTRFPILYDTSLTSTQLLVTGQAAVWALTAFSFSNISLGHTKLVNPFISYIQGRFDSNWSKVPLAHGISTSSRSMNFELGFGVCLNMTKIILFCRQSH